LNAANEEAVAAFRAGRISFTGIGAVVREVLDATPDGPASGLDEVLAIDAEARRRAQRAIQRSGVPSV
jgi:1-deoxy-D-xylulose-5-phosphate reductoisomerase